MPGKPIRARSAALNKFRSTHITTYNITFNDTSTVDKSAAKTLPHADAWGDDNEEMYHSVRFRVTSNGVTSPWTKWEDSTAVSLHL